MFLLQSIIDIGNFLIDKNKKDKIKIKIKEWQIQY